MSGQWELGFADNTPPKPLAARMRPENFSQYIGQGHLLAEGKPLRRAIEAGQCHSMILWGPPGTGKTTLAELIARYANAEVERLSAVSSGVKEVREAIARATERQWRGVRTLLFIDEVHRFNKSQQDLFLPYIEDGTLLFVGATTENPSFELNSALLSRARVYLLKRLTADEIKAMLLQALHDPRGLADLKLQIAPEALDALAQLVDGDGRKALNFLEILADLAEVDAQGERPITLAMLSEVAGERMARFDKGGDHFYDILSALHKSVRGSSPDGAIYWYARLVAAGGDPRTVARRLLAIASEDIGNADPRAMQVALAAWDCYERVGAAEGERAIAQAVLYLAAAPKSNATYLAWSAALAAARSGDYPVPEYLRNAPTALMKSLGYGAEYRYAHNESNAYAAGECYLPSELREQHFYQPNERGMEKQIGEKLAWLKSLDQSSDQRRY